MNVEFGFGNLKRKLLLKFFKIVKKILLTSFGSISLPCLLFLVPLFMVTNLSFAGTRWLGDLTWRVEFDGEI
jgi:hypothetical protein